MESAINHILFLYWNHQISRKQAPTLVVVRKMKFLRSVNVGRFAAVHQHDRATDNVLVYEG